MPPNQSPQPAALATAAAPVAEREPVAEEPTESDLSANPYLREMVDHSKVAKPEYIHAVLDHISEGHSRKSACNLLGISRATLWYWEQRDPDLTRAIEHARNNWSLDILDDAALAGATGRKVLNAGALAISYKRRGALLDRPAPEAQTVDVTVMRDAVRIRFQRQAQRLPAPAPSLAELEAGDEQQAHE